MEAVNDYHNLQWIQWIRNGKWSGVRSIQWGVGQRTGHFDWDDDNTTIGPGYESDGSTLSVIDRPVVLLRHPFRTGSMNDLFNDQIQDMLQLEKFNLLTQGVTERTRTQYLSCWKRWGQYCSCLGISPWLSTAKQGWGDPLIDFLVWEHKIFGLQHSILAKRFYAIRFLHVAEGFGDLALRGQRIKFIIKGVRKRSKTCKKAPFNTDLLKWIHTELSVNKQAKKDRDITQLWAGLLTAFFLCLCISELLALQYRDVKFTRDQGDGSCPY